MTTLPHLVYIPMTIVSLSDLTVSDNMTQYSLPMCTVLVGVEAGSRKVTSTWSFTVSDY